MAKAYVLYFLTGKYTTEAELKKAYRKLAKQFHPDNGGNAEDFKRLQEEYAMLTKRFEAERKAAARKAAAEEAAKRAAEEAKKRAEEAARKAAEEAARKAAEKAAETEGGMPKRVADAIKALQDAGFEAGYHRRTYLWVNWPGAGKVRVNCLKNGEFKFSYHGKVFAGVKNIDDLMATLRQ